MHNMSRYAVKIGEIHLISEEPITAEQRKAIAEKLHACGYKFNFFGLDVTLAVDGH